MNLEKIKKELVRMEDAESKILDILLYSNFNISAIASEEVRLAVNTLFDISKYIMELKHYIEKIEGGQDE